MQALKKVKVRSEEKIRVLIADSDGQSSRRTQMFLNQQGFDCRISPNGNDAKKVIAAWKPKVLLVDLLLPDANAFELLRYCQRDPAINKLNLAVLIMSGHNSPENVRDAYQMGARDYIARPFMYQDLLNRVVFHCRDTREYDQKKSSKDSSLLSADVIVSQALQNISMEEMLYQFTKMAANRTGALRCSIIHTITQDKGVVLGSNDKSDIAGLPLSLKKYPEIQLTMNTGKILVIDNLDDSKALGQIKKLFSDVQFNAMIVCPIYYHQKIFGAISVRMPKDDIRVADSKIEYVEFLAKVLSLYLSTLDAQIIGRYGLVQVPK